jgi:hypothetical protein
VFRLANAEVTLQQKRRERAYVGNARGTLEVCARWTLVLSAGSGSNPKVKNSFETIEILCESFTTSLHIAR